MVRVHELRGVEVGEVAPRRPPRAPRGPPTRAAPGRRRRGARSPSREIHRRRYLHASRISYRRSLRLSAGRISARRAARPRARGTPRRRAAPPSRAPGAVDVLARRGVQGPHRRVAEVVLGEAVPHVLLQVAVANRQAPLREEPSPRRERRWYTSPVTGSIRRPSVRSSTLAWSTSSTNTLSGSCSQRRRLVKVMREPVENPTSRDAILARQRRARSAPS